MKPIVVSPEAVRYQLLLTARQPISHHDPRFGSEGESNRQVFNRKPMNVPVKVAPPIVDIPMVKVLAQKHPVPQGLVAFSQKLSVQEFLATALLKTFIEIYGAGDGEGLFAGMSRYQRLEPRVRDAAANSSTLQAFWDTLTRTMNVPIHGGKSDLDLLDFFSLPAGTEQAVLYQLQEHYRTAVMGGREWAQTAKLANEAYAEAAGVEALVEPMVTLQFDEAITTPERRKAYLPSVTGNTIRHQVVRAPAWEHLCAALGLEASTPGKGPVPEGVEAMMDNGGNIRSGAKAPDAAFRLANEVRARYPSLDLLGGCTDSFFLGDSQLDVFSTLVCRECAGALEGTGAEGLPEAQQGALEFLADATRRRGGETKDTGKMIYAFQTLIPGSKVLCQFDLHPQTFRLTQGALMAAIDWFLHNNRTIGGQAARGFGLVTGEWLVRPEGSDEAMREYNDYLAMDRDNLKQGLVSGELCTGKALFRLD